MGKKKGLEGSLKKIFGEIEDEMNKDFFNWKHSTIVKEFWGFGNIHLSSVSGGRQGMMMG